MPVPTPPAAIQMSRINTELGLSATLANSSLETRASQTGGYVGGAPNIAFSEFAGYPPPPVDNYHTFDIHNDRYDEPTEACLFGGQDNLTLYFAGSGGTPACPTSGVFLFTDSALTQAFSGQNSYWKSNQCGAAFYIVKNNQKDGFIEGVIPC